MTASVRQFKADLSRYLKRAASGERIVVTSRGKPIAQVVAAVELTERELSAPEERRRLATVRGIILPTGPKPRGSARPIRLRKGTKPISQTVLEDRR